MKELLDGHTTRWSHPSMVTIAQNPVLNVIPPLYCKCFYSDSLTRLSALCMLHVDVCFPWSEGKPDRKLMSRASQWLQNPVWLSVSIQNNV